MVRDTYLVEVLNLNLEYFAVAKLNGQGLACPMTLTK